MLKIWTTRLVTFVLWALAAGSAAFWVLHAAGSTASASTSAAAPSSTPIQTPNLTPKVALALGAQNSVAPTAASQLAATQARFQLMGVLAVGSKNGAALIAVDGKSAKPYRVGAPVEDGLEVTSVAARSASIGTGGATAFTLELPLKN